jgi:threonine dehydrogenase-like Zn-dependent dehydrogenase
MRIREVVVTGQRQVELQEREVDLAPALGQVLIETEKTFVSAGTELANYMARDAGVWKPGNWCAYPWRSGYGNVGIVREAGPGVTRTKVGQRVLSYGNHASFVRYEAESNLVFPVPEGIEPEVAAASRMAGVAMTSIILAEFKGAPWVVVYGLGAVGNLAAQGFALRGCRVIGVDPVPARRALAERCGIAFTAGGTPDEVRTRVKAITGGTMAGITVDAVGHSDVIREALAVTAPFGQLVILGSPRVPVEGNLTAAFADIHVRFLTIRGALEWCLPIYPGPTPGMSQYEKQAMIFDWVVRGELKLEPLISHRLPPEKIKDAYEGLETDKGAFTGVVLDWTTG